MSILNLRGSGNEDSIEQADTLLLRPKLSFSGVAYEQDFVRYYHAFYYRYAQASLAVGNCSSTPSRGRS
jgi:hypothetical protein